MLPDLSKLSHRCEPCGVTRQTFTMTSLVGQQQECTMCMVSLHYPAFGFVPSDGEIYDLQKEFDKKLDPTPEEVEEYDTAARKAADKIRGTNASRTQIEVLDPGCGHQFHRFCLSRHVKSNAGNRDQCVICYELIDRNILSSLRGSLQRGVTRQRNAPARFARNRTGY